MPQEREVYAAGLVPPHGSGRWWMLSGGTGFAAIFLILLPGGRKRYRLALGLGLVCVLAFTIGCGGFKAPPRGGGGGGAGKPHTTNKGNRLAEREAGGTLNLPPHASARAPRQHR